jgi:CubicO group peptidase (beta-lactamase class C family)
MADADVDEVVTGVLRARRCPGAVVTIATPGSVRNVAVGSQSGEADGDAPVDGQLWFEIGSVTKPLVATLVLQHVARGDVALDDPVRAHVPEFRLAAADATERVTIRHLLTHASGIDRADDFTDTGDDEDCVRRYVDEVVAGAGLVHPVGDRWSYCNAGYVVLGRLVEVLDGRPWDVALEARILGPCAMDASNRRLAPADRAVAVGHRVDPATGAVSRNDRRTPASVGPAGNVVATGEALVRFVDALFGEGDRLLPRTLVAEMTTPCLAARDVQQGLGFALVDRPVPIAFHAGSTLGSTAFLGAIPSVESAVAVVANGPAAGAVALAVFAHLAGAPLPAPSGPEPSDAVATDAVTGRYVRRHVAQEVDLVGGNLTVRTRFSGPLADLAPDPPDSRLEPVDARRFVSRQPFAPEPERWDFVDDEHGRPARLFTQRVHVRE